MSQNNGGDVLARGGVKATFRTAGSKVTAEQWAAIWAPEVTNDEVSLSDSHAEASRDVSPKSGEAQPDQARQ